MKDQGPSIPDPQAMVRRMVKRQQDLLTARQRSYRGTKHAPGATKALPCGTTKSKRKATKNARRMNRNR